MDTAFSALALPQRFLENLNALGYHQMTPVQAHSLPPVLAGRDVIVRAKTGSGKTAAFGIGMLQRLNPTLFAVQGLVLCPTRELADQVAGELRRLARGIGNVKIVTLTGGVPLRPQAASLEHGAHIVVGTPGRIVDHLGRRSLQLARLNMLVLDEADRMTDMGFMDEIATIVRATPSHRQTLLFSATYPDDIRAACAHFLRDPEEVAVDTAHEDTRIVQRFIEVDHAQRDAAAARLLRHLAPDAAIVFCNTRVHCEELAQRLRDDGVDALALYGELEQRERDEILVRFANRSVRVLVATDVAARGLDIAGLDLVLSVGVSRDADVHLHRIGRTGRAGASGQAFALCTPGDRKWVEQIERQLGSPVEWLALASIDANAPALPPAPMRTLCIAGGKRDKLRPGDLLGALTGDAGLTREQVGKIAIFDFVSYVGVERSIADAALARLTGSDPLGPEHGRIKGRGFKMRFLDA